MSATGPGAQPGEHRLRRVTGGVCRFGQVRVRVVDDAAGPPVVWLVDPDDRTSAQPGSDQECVDAALAGAADGLALVGLVGRTAEVVHVQFDLTDIDASAVRTAAALAVADAVGLSDRVEAVFEGRWPARLREISG